MLINMHSSRIGNEMISCKMRELQRTIVSEVDTCAGAFDGLALFVDSAVVDVGSSPSTSTAARTLAMLAIAVLCPEFRADSSKGRTPIYTVILTSEVVRVYERCRSINCVTKSKHRSGL